MSLDSLFPAAGDHAIQNAVFAIEFEGALSPGGLKDIQRAAEKSLGKDFPEVQPQQTMSFSLNVGNGQSAQPMKPVPQYGGFILTKPGFGFTPAPARTLTLNPNACLIVINDYSRWAQVKADVDRYQDFIFKAAHMLPVRAIGLQYTDLFLWRADPAELDLSEVFAPATPYLPSNVYSLPRGSLWHAHHGYFVRKDEPIAYQQLDNVNVNCVESGGSHAIQVLTSHKAQFGSPMWKAGKDNRAVISTLLDRLHESNKGILNALMSSEVKAKIKLS